MPGDSTPRSARNTARRKVARPFASLLVANRGEIASRIFRTARELGLRTVAVYADEDRSAPFVLEADEARPLLGSTATTTYLDGAKVVAAAVAAGADGIHPGYGFLSEDAAFAEAVIAAGLIWVGPDPHTIRQMADKPTAKARLADAGVPTLPSAAVDLEAPRSWAAAGRRVGFPLLVKAAAGGGGRGMRLVRAPTELKAAVEAASREASSSFGRPQVFLERYLAAARHIEIQVVADRAGTTLALGDRECSIQRRHQKVLEEAPAPGLGRALRAKMAEAAVAGAESIGYTGVGTFEFLVEAEDFYFLEMNTRLQVEHPVTEEVSGLDLVRLQLEIAAGRPLGITKDEIVVDGHAIEARLYAEDPAAGWLPSPGILATWRAGPTAPLRWDTGVAGGSLISPHFDPMLAKAVAHAPTREEAAARLARALDELRVHGVRTNRDFLVALLRDRDFVRGPTTISFIDDHPDLLGAGPGTELLRWHALAATLADVARRRSEAGALGFAPAGWRNLTSQLHRRTWSGPLGTCEVRYHISASVGGVLSAEVDGHCVEATLVELTPTGVDVECGLGRLRFEVTRASGRDRAHSADSPAHCFVDGGFGPHAHSEWVEVPRLVDPGAAEAVGGGVIAAIPGVVTAVAVAAGQRVAAMDRLVVMEAMKMEHVIAAPFPATVLEVHVDVGIQVEAHQVLVTLEAAPDDIGDPEARGS
jgi:propionyl-CoA carboxylase alpha chain